MGRIVIDIPLDVDADDAAQHIRGECCRRGYKVVDYDLDDFADRRYVVVEKVKKAKADPKRRFFR